MGSQAGSPGPEWRALLQRADALAGGGRLPEACRLYQRACRRRPLRPEQLGRLVQGLARRVRRREGLGGGAPQPRHGDVFRCRKCHGFLCEPVSLPCGHTFCKRCLERAGPAGRCVQCRAGAELEGEGEAGAGQPLRVNVLLSSLLAKWFPGQARASQLRHEGNVLYRERKPQAALHKYNEAVSLGKRWK